MSVDINKTKLFKNIKRQSLRLEQLLNLPKHQVHTLLARHFYNENTIADVRKKITSNSLEGRIFLAAVAPDASEQILSKFADEFANILVSVATSPICKVSNNSPRDLILEVFSLDKNVMNNIIKNSI